jgi:site-specific recombinase
MKNSIILGFIVALIMAVVAVCFFVHPVLVLTIGDILTMILVDVVISFVLALYLSDYFSSGNESKQKSLLIWVIVGAAIPIVPMIAAFLKYKKEKK